MPHYPSKLRARLPPQGLRVVPHVPEIKALGFLEVSNRHRNGFIISPFFSLLHPSSKVLDDLSALQVYLINIKRYAATQVSFISHLQELILVAIKVPNIQVKIEPFSIILKIEVSVDNLGGRSLSNFYLVHNDLFLF